MIKRVCSMTQCSKYNLDFKYNCRKALGPECLSYDPVSQAIDRPAATPQPMATGNGDVVLLDLIQDLLARDQVGRVKYKTSLKTDNGRDALMDAYQEALDLCMYLNQAILERDNG